MGKRHDESTRSSKSWSSFIEASLEDKKLPKHKKRQDEPTRSIQSWSSFIEATLEDKKGPKHKAWTDMVKVATAALNDATDAMGRVQRRVEVVGHLDGKERRRRRPRRGRRHH